MANTEQLIETLWKTHSTFVGTEIDDLEQLANTLVMSHANFCDALQFVLDRTLLNNDIAEAKTMARDARKMLKTRQVDTAGLGMPITYMERIIELLTIK